jgi:hypothetical protein
LLKPSRSRLLLVLPKRPRRRRCPQRLPNRRGSLSTLNRHRDLRLAHRRNSQQPSERIARRRSATYNHDSPLSSRPLLKVILALYSSWRAARVPTARRRERQRQRRDRNRRSFPRRGSFRCR